jgi:hydroxyacylglutathione hydrolase
VWGIECLATGVLAVVDGPGSEEVEAFEHANGLRASVLLTTHTHGDHIGIHRAWEATGRLAGMHVFGKAGVGVPGLTHPVDDGDGFQVGAVSGTVLRTEGHMNGHVSYLIDGALFCGDTLFGGGCGYLFDGPPERMFDSLMRLAGLPDETLVCCAHEYTQDNLRFAVSVEPNNQALAARDADVATKRADGQCTLPSTIAVERATNPFLRTGSPELRMQVGFTGPHADVFAHARALKNTGAYKR